MFPTAIAELSVSLLNSVSFCFHAFWASLVRRVCIYYSSVFLMDRLFYCYKKPIFASNNNLSWSLFCVRLLYPLHLSFSYRLYGIFFCPFIFIPIWIIHSVVSDSLQSPWTVARQTPLLWDFPSKTTGIGYHALLQGIFLSQGTKPHLVSPAFAGRFLNTITTREAHLFVYLNW